MNPSTKTRRRPSAASIVATVALFVGLGSAAVAAPLITGKDIKNRSVATKDLSKKTVKSIGKTYADNTPEDVTNSLTRTLEVEVPRGSYTAHSDLELHATDAAGEGECRLRAVGGTPTLLGYTGYMSIADSPNNIEQRFVSLGAAFKTTGGVVSLDCKGIDLSTPLTGDLVVTKVGSIVGL